MAIRNILFDIGYVLLDFDREAVVRELAASSRTIHPERFGREQVFLPGAIEEFETGRIGGEEYFARFCQVSGCELPFGEFRRIWCAHFTEIAPMIALGRELSRDYRIYLFSDTNPLHVPAVYELHPALRFFHGEALSYRLGALKSHPGFFERALEQLGLAAGECLFIDDLEANVLAARANGIRAICHRDPESTRRGLLAALGDGSAPHAPR